jgi:hypothetical protein
MDILLPVYVAMMGNVDTVWRLQLNVLLVSRDNRHFITQSSVTSVGCPVLHLCERSNIICSSKALTILINLPNGHLINLELEVQ